MQIGSVMRAARALAVCCLAVLSACEDAGGSKGEGDDTPTPVKPGEAPPVGASQVAYRVNTMKLLHPHVWFAMPPLVSCQDVTNSAPLGQASVNKRIEDAINGDIGNGQPNNTTPDGSLDASLLLVFKKFDTGPGNFEATMNAGKCKAPLANTSCEFSGQQFPVTIANKNSGSCLPVPAGSINSSYGTLNAPSSPCAEVRVGDFNIEPLLGIPITVKNASVAFTYVDGGKTLTGYLTGDLSTAEAATNTVDLGVGGGQQTVASLFAGGTGNCKGGTLDDRDQASGRTVWKFYLPVTAQVVQFKK